MEEIRFIFPEKSYHESMLENEFGGLYGLVFSSTQQIDRLVESLKECKQKYIKEKQRRFDYLHQLSLNFN